MTSKELKLLIQFDEEIAGYPELDENRIITDQEKISYVEAYNRWKAKKFDSDFDRGMSEPNPPNYFRANND